MRRARFALATGMLLAAAVPGTVEAGQAPAAASPVNSANTVLSDRQSAGPIGLAITGITPSWARPGDTITVSGTVTNDSATVLSHLSVALDFAGASVSSLAQLQQDMTSAGALAGNPIPGRQTLAPGGLPPHKTVSWSISFPASKIGMTTFGVYPLTAHVDNSLGTALAVANTFVPYVPASHGRFAKSMPARQRIAWLWPTMDVPLTAIPGQAECSGAQVRALRTSLGNGGRLQRLLTVGSQYTAADKLTWAVDPALLADAKSLAGCGIAGSRAAGAWLSKLKKTTAGQQLFATPYANVSLALDRQGHDQDVTTAFDLARSETKSDLGRDVGSAAGVQLGGSTAWTTGDVTVSLLSFLILNIRIHTVVLPSDTVADPPGTSFTTQANTAASLNVLLSSSALTQLLGSSGQRRTSAFTTAQEFLAETALMARQGSADPIVVAPPQHPLSWQPTTTLATALLKETATAPWLNPVSLSSLATGKRKPDPNPRMVSTGDSGSFSGRVLRALTAAEYAVKNIGYLAANSGPGTDAAKALAALESANWPARAWKARLHRLQVLTARLDADEGEVRIVTGSRVTLGGLKGNVPVVISNKLDYPVKVRVVHSFAQPPGGGLTVQQSRKGVVTVGALRQVTVTLHVDATQVGSTTIYLRLLNIHGGPLPTPVAGVIVQATQFGTIAMIILAAVLGLFVIASAGRSIRRGGQERAASTGPPDDGGDAGHPQASESEGSQEVPEPDTVVPERSELGATGTSLP